MPVYEYECERCRLRFELRRHFGEDDGTSCPQCQGDTRRLFSPVPIIFKGSGFYVTDARKDHKQPPDENKTEKLQSDKKSQSN